MGPDKHLGRLKRTIDYYLLDWAFFSLYLHFSLGRLSNFLWTLKDFFFFEGTSLWSICSLCRTAVAVATTFMVTSGQWLDHLRESHLQSILFIVQHLFHIFLRVECEPDPWSPQPPNTRMCEEMGSYALPQLDLLLTGHFCHLEDFKSKNDFTHFAVF